MTVVKAELIGYNFALGNTLLIPARTSSNEINNWTITKTKIQLNATWSYGGDGETLYFTLFYTKTS
jgi:hypothetical protein